MFTVNWQFDDNHWMCIEHKAYGQMHETWMVYHMSMVYVNIIDLVTSGKHSRIILSYYVTENICFIYHTCHSTMISQMSSGGHWRTSSIGVYLCGKSKIIGNIVWYLLGYFLSTSSPSTRFFGPKATLFPNVIFPQSMVFLTQGGGKQRTC